MRLIDDRVKYNPFTTAIKRDYLSKPTRELLRRNLLHGDILDFGCGRGADVKWLEKDYKLSIWGYDKYNEEYNKPYLLEQKYDCIICNYVFNVIPSIKEHMETLELIRNIGKEVYICVRADVVSVKETWVWDSKEQGYWTPKNTFQRFYDSDSVGFLFGDVTYIINNNEMKLFKLNKTI